MTDGKPMKPSEVFIDTIPPLTGVFRHSESEAAGALLVNACRQRGDVFDWVTPKQIGETLNLEEEPWKSLNRNPFFRPDFRMLAADGFAEFDGDPDGHGIPIRFTEKGLTAMRTALDGRWYRPTQVDGNDSGSTSP